MVQMIPWTYNLMRQRHPGVGLNPDFVLGMRNHGNALEAMLLYMQDTWNDLSANEDVQAAMAAKQATNLKLSPPVTIRTLPSFPATFVARVRLGED